MKRRQFFTSSAAGLAGMMIIPSGLALAQDNKKKAGKKEKFNHSNLPKFRIRTLTSGPMHHFFGYYGMSTWNKSETKMVCMESSFQDRMPEPGETATIGLVNPVTGAFSPITKTLAWNLQQGSLLHWNPLEPDDEIIYNDQSGNELVSVKLNVTNGNKSFLPRPISGVATKGKYALSLTYGRLGRLRAVVGYAGAVDPFANEAHPKQDGVFLIDLKTNETRLIISIAEVFEKSVAEYPELVKRHLWLDHTVINPSGTRFLFLARSKNEKGKLDSAMFTVSIDGTDLRQVIPFGTSVSHFGWRNDREIIATFILPGETQIKHFLFKDGESDYQVVGENFIIDDGHCTFSPNGRLMATDRTQDESNSRSLWLYDMELNQGMILCDIPYPDDKYLHTDTRCDFHPRWNPSGNKICFDAIDTATLTRQMYLVEFIDI